MQDGVHESDAMINDAKVYIRNLYDRYIDPTVFRYHNFNHIQSVFEQVSVLSAREDVSEIDSFALKMAALFHDSGIHINYTSHEEVSVKIVTDFLEDQNASDDFIGLVCRLIMSTVLSYKPLDMLECIIKDADLSNLGTDSFFASSQNLRQEWGLLGQRYFENDLLFFQEQLSFLQGHSYFTKTAQQLYDKKTENLAQLRVIIEQLKAGSPDQL